MNKKTTASKIWGIASTAIVVLFVVIAVALMGLRIFGLTPYSVLTGSMTGVYNEGDLIYVKKVTLDELKVGDDITFMLNEDKLLATHRIIAIDSERGYVQTKGLHNDNPDAPVHYKNIVGKVVFSLPALGYVSDWVMGTPGKYISISLGVLFVVALFIPDIIRKKKTTAEPDDTPSDKPAEDNETAE